MEREIKFEIKLKCLKDKNGHKAGDFVTIINNVFDRKNGIAFWPIDLDFDIVYKRQFTGYKDKNKNEIYEGDIIGDWNEIDGKMEQSKQTVYFDEMLGQWMLDNSFKQDRSLSYSLFSELQDFEYEIIGNVYENPELLTPNNPTHETTNNAD